MKARPQYFIQKKNQSEGPAGKPSFWPKLVGFSLTFVLLAAIIAVVAWQGNSIFVRVSSNWNEIKFAYDKPELVQPTRLDYQKRTNALDKSIAEKQQREDDAKQKALVETAAKEMLKVTPTGQY